MKIMLIGGGSNGNNNTPYETKEIDKEIVKMTNKEKPNFLFIGLASSFSDSYYDVMKNIYKSLGCETNYLKKSNLINNPSLVKEKFNNADIIYISGGDTNKLLNKIKDYNLEPLLKESINKNKVIAGISAGSIILANEGLSDYQIMNNISDKYVFIKGLNYLNINICPHSDLEKRMIDLKELIKNTNKEVICLENGTALKIENNDISIIKSIKNNNIKLITYKDNNYKEIVLDHKNLKELLKI